MRSSLRLCAFARDKKCSSLIFLALKRNDKPKLPSRKKMSQSLTITAQDILEQVKHSGKIPEIIEEILSRKVINEAANEAEIKATPEELQAVADEFRLSHRLHSATDTWKWLRKNALSLDDFEAIVRHNLLSVQLAVHLFQDKVSPYFVEHQIDYMGVVMYEVIFQDEDLAMEQFLSISEKEISFYEVAHQYIQKPELRRKGGYRGVLYRRDLKPEISAAVFAANPPQLLPPITTSKGVHLILVEEIVQPQLDEQLAYQIGADLFAQWLKESVGQIEFELVLD